MTSTKCVVDEIEPMKGVTLEKEQHLDAEALEGFLLMAAGELQRLRITTAALHTQVALAHLRLHIDARTGSAGAEPYK
jgi:hypothetical protein